MSTRDERLAALLDRLGDDQRRGRADVEALVAEHPDLGEELRQLWAVAQVAHAFTRTADPDQTASVAPRIVLPGRARARVRRLRIARRDRPWRDGHRLQGPAEKSEPHCRVENALAWRRGEASRSRRIRAEALAAAGLKHPNIVPVYEVGEQDDRDYFTMPYVEGQSLAQRLSDGPLPPRGAAQLVAEVARAVQHAPRTRHHSPRSEAGQRALVRCPWSVVRCNRKRLAAGKQRTTDNGPRTTAPGDGFRPRQAAGAWLTAKKA